MVPFWKLYFYSVTSYQKRHLTSVDLILPHAWISTPNKEQLMRELLHIEVLAHKSDEPIALVFSDSELFEKQKSHRRSITRS